MRRLLPLGVAFLLGWGSLPSALAMGDVALTSSTTLGLAAPQIPAEFQQVADASSASEGSLGLEAFENGRWQDAVAHFSKALAVKPDSAMFSLRGVAYHQLGQDDKALADYNAGLALNPDPEIRAELLINRGLSRHSLGDADGALKDYDTAIEINPSEPSAYYNRGLVYGAKNNFAKAIEDFTKAIDRNPEEPRSYHFRGLAKAKTGDYKGAMVDLDKAIELNPNMAEAFAIRAISRSSLGDLAGGLKDAKHARELAQANHQNELLQDLTTLVELLEKQTKNVNLQEPQPE